MRPKPPPTSFDARPWFALAATGHPDVLPGGSWVYRASPELVADVPGVWRVWGCLDAALQKRWAGHRIALYGRAGRSGLTTGIDVAVHHYAIDHGLPYIPLSPTPDVWRESAVFRRDLELVGRSHALLWFGGEESDGDPLALCRLLGLPHQAIKSVV